ncbi:transcription factor [Ganoderma sinense ZZ0214-1]|uniref:Transcription factor n=1 Tax=Ganoderma sinense ZZ0214-1 TaxID=1077348 RepID=A0A2G8SGA0_9APHY|nr:transcription factor [Ganoderma sinense ZZ0214-1]
MSHHPTPLSNRPFETKQALVEWVTVTGNSENGEIKKPPNSFLIFRKWFNRFSLPLLILSLGQGAAPQQSALSRFLGLMWTMLPEQHRAFWKDIGRDVQAYHVIRYPSFHTPEAEMKRNDEKREKQKRKAPKSSNAESGGPGPKRSPKGTARSSPYPPQLAQSLPSPTIPASNLFHIHASTSLPTVTVPTIPVDAYPASIPAYRPVAHPAMYGPSSPSYMAPSSSFAAPPSFHPPSATHHFSSPLPPSSFLAPPPPGSASYYRQHAPPFSPAPLPFPITSSMPTTTMHSSSAMYPPQAQYQVTPGGYPSMTFLPSPQRSDIDFNLPSDFFGLPQAGATLGMQPLPVNNLFPAQQPVYEIPAGLFDIDVSDSLFQLPN